MAIKIRHYLFIILISFIFSLKVNAQETDKKTSLSQILKSLEGQFNVQFNYAEEAILNTDIIAPSKDYTLKKALRYLEAKTGLEFILANDNVVLIISNSNNLKLQTLSEVTVAGYIVKGINKLNNGSFEIDISDFDILPGLIDTDVLQAVQAFPGIQSINETVSNINIRGGTHDQNLILWDNIKMYQSGHFFGLISMFNPQITQRVSLTKNGTTTEFTDGVSGTIAMETEKFINKDFKGNIGINFIDANGFVDVPISKKSSLQIATRKSISDFTETPTYNNYFERISQNTEVENNAMDIVNSNKQFDFYDASLRWIYIINDKEELRINFINAANELVFNESINEESRESSLKQNSIAGAIYYSKLWNSKWQTTFEGYETDYKLKSINANVLDAQRFLQENKVSETSLKLKIYYNINNRLSLLNGYHFVETQVTNLDDVDNPLFRLLVSEVVRTHGVFSQISYKSKDRNTNLITGLRYNYIDKFKKHLFEPRLSFSHKFLQNFSFEILGEFKHQNTSQIINFQNDFLGIEKRRWQLSNNNDIPVIQSKQASVGVSFNKSGWLVSAESYYKKVKGITTQSQGFQNQYEFVKTDGEYNVKGLDFIIRKQLNNFNTWLSYSYMDNKYTFKSLPEHSFPSNFDVTHAITLGTNYTAEKLKISTGINWNSGRPKTSPINGIEINNDEINYNATNSEKLEDYLRIDVSALYDFKLSKTTNANLGISIWNLLDKKNTINNFYRLNDGVVNEIKQQSLGLTPNVIFRVNF
ncbi:TonB-dependent receptor plug domain-containing protein [Winogradskyella echinorum]|uniref:TonB-dependent receptor plug domain-containing protein n=1 Tax=Winogradskyella echinorum TaxID=538189 RepID=A0ABR6XYP3_9FLAO|nr:TonB-dependent receptor plug domain-containing protein [Winogradskyella echinorum]MBC3845601.1 TonB-dependent receptor plug domain-containing protein [Winogradskyella echinorum]MBC5749949.1 TonB-dependent receptor plug domain-containing protein [Winogradskyella echinorum]